MYLVHYLTIYSYFCRVICPKVMLYVCETVSIFSHGCIGFNVLGFSFIVIVDILKDASEGPLFFSVLASFDSSRFGIKLVSLGFCSFLCMIRV